LVSVVVGGVIAVAVLGGVDVVVDANIVGVDSVGCVCGVLVVSDATGIWSKSL